MAQNIPVLSYYNYLLIGRQLRFAGTILRSTASVLYIGNEINVFQHIGNLLKLYTPNFFRSAQLELRYKGKKWHCNVDYKGNFVAMIPLEPDDEEIIFDDIHLRLIWENDSSLVYRPNMYFETLKLKEYSYGVISDIDDTILETGATTLFERIKHIILTKPTARRYIKDMPHIYRKLSRDNARLYYVSNSEANLFSVISRFLIENKFPQGACFLRKNKLLSVFLKKPKVKRSKTSHKLRTISLIIRTQPEDKKFVLIGDNGQWDLFVYKKITELFPGRINYVFLRDIHNKIRNKKREVHKGVPIIHFSNIAEIKSFIDRRVVPEEGVQPELRQQ